LKNNAIRSIRDPGHRGTGFSTTSCLFLAAVSVGWLIGLSASPVLHVIVGSVIAVVVALAGTLAGIQTQINFSDEQTKIDQPTPKSTMSAFSLNPVPVAVFTIGIAIGATIGIIARTNEFFGTDKAMFVGRWQGIGLTDVEIKRRLFDQLYPPVLPDHGATRDRIASGGGSDSHVQSESNNPRVAALTAGLFAASVDDCQLLAGKHGAELRGRLLAIKGDAIQSALNECHGDDCLEALKVLVCPK
jgi:hypothetical protein